MQVGVETQVFILRQHLCSGYVATLSSIICISVMTQKVCCDRGLLPLSFTSCCSFVMMLRHGFLVLLIFAVATRLFCVQLNRYVTTQFVMSQPLYCVKTFVATWKSLSRPRFSLLSLFPCCNIKIHVMT